MKNILIVKEDKSIPTSWNGVLDLKIEKLFKDAKRVRIIAVFNSDNKAKVATHFRTCSLEQDEAQDFFKWVKDEVADFDFPFEDGEGYTNFKPFNPNGKTIRSKGSTKKKSSRKISSSKKK
jgi:hypothetical protein